jgi:hypothetical protein
MSLITVTGELRKRLPKLSPFYSKTATKAVTYDGTNMVIDGTGITGTQISFSDIVIRADVTAYRQVQHNGIALLELTFNGFLPIVYDKREPAFAEVELINRNTNEATSFAIYDIDNTTNKLYLKTGVVPPNVLQLSYLGTNHYVNTVYTEGVSFSRSGGNILIPTEQFSNYAFAQAKVNTELYITFWARNMIEDNQPIQASPKPSGDKRCLVFVEPSLERVASTPSTQASGAVYVSEGNARDIRYIVYFRVILAVYGAWDNMSKGAMYKFLEDRKHEVDSLLTGFKPIDTYTKMPVESACVLTSSRYGNLDNIKGILSCELEYQYSYRSPVNTYLADMSEYYNINKIDLYTKTDINGEPLVAENLIDNEEEHILNEHGSYLFTEDSNLDTSNSVAYKDYLANLPSF